MEKQIHKYIFNSLYFPDLFHLHIFYFVII